MEKEKELTLDQQEEIVRKAVSKGVSLGTNIIANHTMESL